MIPRKISNEEIAAITTLIQHAENIGSEAFTEDDIHKAIGEAYRDTPTQRSKDVDTDWMLTFIGKTKEILHSLGDTIAIKEEDIQVPHLLGGKKYKKAQENEYVAIWFKDGGIDGGKLIAVEEGTLEDDLSLEYETTKTVKQSETKEVVFCNGTRSMEMQMDGMAEEDYGEQEAEDSKKEYLYYITSKTEDNCHLTFYRNDDKLRMKGKKIFGSKKKLEEAKEDGYAYSHAVKLFTKDEMLEFLSGKTTVGSEKVALTVQTVDLPLAASIVIHIADTPQGGGVGDAGSNDEGTVTLWIDKREQEVPLSGGIPGQALDGTKIPF